MKRKMRMGKHTSLSTALRKNLSVIFKQDGVKRVILGLAHGCKHSFEDGYLKIQREEKGKLLLNGYSSSGVIKIVLILEENVDIEKVKKLIEEEREGK